MVRASMNTDTSRPKDALPAAVWTGAHTFTEPPQGLPGVQHWLTDIRTTITRTALRLGRWLRLPVLDYRSSLLLDLESWPPRLLHLRDEYIVAGDVAPDGRSVFCSWLAGSGYNRLQFHEAGEPGRRGLTIPPLGASPLTARGHWPNFFRVMTVGRQVFAVSGLFYTQHDQVFRLAGDKAVPVRGLPPPSGTPGQGGPGAWTHGKVRLTVGTDVLIWCGDGYELRGRKLERTWALGCRQAAPWGNSSWGEWSTIPWGDGFYYLSGNELFQARRGSPPRRAWPDADDVEGLTPGPAGSVLVQHGHRGGNRRSLVGRVWFPDDGSFIPLRKKDLTKWPRSPFGSLHWSEATRQLYILGWGDFTTVPGDEILSLKRIRPRSRKRGG